MGSYTKIKCPRCGKVYEWSEGEGFTTRILHCDRCGKKKQMKLNAKYAVEDLVCKCGGSFSEDAPIRCPECKAVFEWANAGEPLIIGQWD